MLVQLLLLITGLILVVFGADALVDGASSIAKKAGISDFVIGLTIVGFGTSCPELVVSLTGALEGSSDIAIGNVVGSNFFNTLLILGLTAVIVPIGITPSNKKIDIPLTILVTLILCLCAYLWNGIGRVAAVGFLLLFILYMVYCFKFTKPEESGGEGAAGAVAGWKEKMLANIAGSLAFVFCGFAALIFGGRLFVDSAVAVAKLAGVSDKFIAITVLAAGTSLPELATSVMAAAKDKGQLALGNILGSNIFNILFILGTAAVVSPLVTEGISIVDWVALIFSTVLLLVFAYTGRKSSLNRWEGAVMLLCFVAYYVYLFLTI